MKAKEKQLLEYLKKHCPGRENAISGKQMKKRFRIHEAELRKLVHKLRMAFSTPSRIRRRCPIVAITSQALAG